MGCCSAPNLLYLVQPPQASYALLTGFRQGLGLPKVTQQVEAARGSGLLTLHLLHPSTLLPRLDSQQSACLAEVNRNDFLLMNKSQKNCPGVMVGDSWPQLQSGRPSTPGTDPWLPLGMAVGLGNDSSSCPLPAGSGGTSGTPLATTSKQYLWLCSWGLGPSDLADPPCVSR